MRIRPIPLFGGVAIVNGLAGIDPTMHIASSPYAPFPLAGDIQLGKIRLIDVPNRARFIEQRYDFSCGELHSRFAFAVDGTEAQVQVLTFCSRSHPTLVLQEIDVQVNEPVDVVLSAMVDPRGIAGHWSSRSTVVAGEDGAPVDGSLLWATYGDVATCGASYTTEFLGPADATRSSIDEDEAPLVTRYAFKTVPGEHYRLRQITSMLASELHRQPDAETVRLVAEGKQLGFDVLRERNRDIWSEIWKGRICLEGAGTRWQGLADAAYFYLQSSAHASSYASTHIFGLAQWDNYHYYYGHVMWDLETFAVPPLLLTQPEAVRAILDYRHRHLESARANARLHGYAGVQFPWESSPDMGQEAAPGTGTAAAYEQHVNFSVALAFAQFVHATGDRRFLRERAWPVLAEVADWIASRVTKTDRGYEIKRTMGIAERKDPSDNVAYVNMGATLTLREAIAAAQSLDLSPPGNWGEMASGLVLPVDPRTQVILDHDGYRRDEEKGATPGALAGLFPLGYEVTPEVERATIDFYLKLASRYIGSPMLSALYGVWATRVGDRTGAARLFEEGYAAFVSDRFLNTHEYREDVYPDQPVAGPFTANLAGFLTGCLYGLPGLKLGPGTPESWCERPVVLPEGWDEISVERLWVRGEPMRLVARHGDEHARLEPAEGA